MDGCFRDVTQEIYRTHHFKTQAECHTPRDAGLISAHSWPTSFAAIRPVLQPSRQHPVSPGRTNPDRYWLQPQLTRDSRSDVLAHVRGAGGLEPHGFQPSAARIPNPSSTPVQCATAPARRGRLIPGQGFSPSQYYWASLPEVARTTPRPPGQAAAPACQPAVSWRIELRLVSRDPVSVSWRCC